MSTRPDPRSDGWPAACPRPPVAAARRIVIKLGTRVLTRDDGRLALSRLSAVVETAAAAREAGREVLIVSSGAVGLGQEALELDELPSDLAVRQACAAVGQSRLMALYQDAFGQFGLICAQVLLTQGDFDDRGRYLNLRRTLTSLLERGVVPILNENDAVATEELVLLERGRPESGRRPVFGDNDRLSALLASKLHADLLVLLTDVEGCFDKDPRRHADARLLSRAASPEALLAAAGTAGTAVSRGGMRSKVEAAQVAARGGCQAVIASGREPGTLERVLRGDELGTWIPARGHLRARHRWIAFAAAPRGALHLDAGAVTALSDGRASLLAAGVSRVEGEFRPGDVVELRGPDGALLGRGRMAWTADTVRAWCDGHPPAGARNAHALIRRDHLVLEIGP